MISLRPMTMDDAELMLEWKNYPETRRFSLLTPDPIKLKDHLRYLSKNLQFFRAMEGVGNVPVGAVRVTEDQEVSIWVDKKFWGRGLAKYTLDQLAREGMWARIVPGNIGSLRAFLWADFEPTEWVEPTDAVQLSEDGVFMSYLPPKTKKIIIPGHLILRKR